MAKIFIVDDDPELLDALKGWLSRENYLVESAATQRDAVASLSSYDYDVLVLDWTLPDGTGYEICKYYRGKGGAAPILMLTGRSSVDDKAAGLDAGADDYLTKPFHVKELGARLRSLLRRPRNVRTDILKVRNLELDPINHQVSRDGVQIHLAPTEFNLLEFLMRHEGSLFSPETILARVWSADSDRSPYTLRTCIKKLRERIDEPGKPSIIKNVRGLGYVCQGMDSEETSTAAAPAGDL